MKIEKYIFLFLLASIILVSCKKDSPVTTDFGYNYFPTDVKRYIIYDVDSIVHNDFTSTIDTFKYQVKEYIASTFIDNSGRNTLRIERYKKYYNDTIPYSSMPWTLTNVWSANRTNTTAEKVEENERYIKLAFPVEKGETWNGNSFNTLGEEDYTYNDVNTKRTIGNISSDSTLLVIQQNVENLIEKQYYTEIYAKNIGMVYKQIIDVQSNNITAAPIMSRITSGIEFSMTINSYGSD